MKYFTAILYSRDDCEIDRCSDCEGIKAAKERARYMLSDEFARMSETTHARLETKKVAVFADGAETGANSVCEWDAFHPQHTAWEDWREDVPAGNLADDNDARHLGDEHEHANHS